MKSVLDGNAIVYCEGMFNTLNGKTAHGLVRFTKRYHILSVIDSRYAGRDAGEVLDGKIKDISIFGSLDQAVRTADRSNRPASYFIVGLAPDGGRLPSKTKQGISEAIAFGLNIDCGLHDYLSEDPELGNLARKYGVKIRDIRKPAPVKNLHFFDGKIESVKALKIAILGTDSAVGKRTTAWLIANALQEMSVPTEMIGTGQTAWLQGAKYGIIMDSLVNDFVAGEIEHAVWTAWQEEQPQVIIIEGQGSLMNPAYPGGFEILAAGRPDIIVLQHAPARKEYDGFPGYRIQPLARQIEAIELLSGKPVVAVAINHENLPDEKLPLICDATEQAVGVPAFDLLRDGPDGLANLIKTYKDNHARRKKNTPESCLRKFNG